MKVLLLHSHPVESSYGAALHAATRESLQRAGHDVDDCNLYAENFNPVLSREERIGYHDVPDNIEPVRSYVERLQAAEALVIVTPIWNFGWPAILKGYFDRVWLPGVTFDLADGVLTRKLTNIRKVGVVLTYGATRWRAFMAGNPPKKIATRVLRVTTNPARRVMFLAHYDMNNCTPETRAAFLAKVKREMERF
ncbi:putative NADPH-quinone reductase [Neorhizobium sp. R1-B]|uniref:NAD(P)H-dependent oxidoreductase n=1 Tax=Neorhizobium TaxID=1525371 RepID=UPI000CF846B9|nr:MULTISPECIES: NAD(P)H-dependent oxidoreductase [Neorhizobium]TCV74662.1 putative NADPH-quinone reductase [Neorhizobium sp. S3-V5DH]TDX87848.1 putative NADPH-quinone reductase [Neorhizobium sp. R1-B]